MIAACPKCQAKYRVDTERLSAGEARLRCAKCQAVFRVRAPKGMPTGNPEPAPEPVLRSVPQTAAPIVPASPSPAVERVAMRAPQQRTSSFIADPLIDRERLILVADPDIEAGKAALSALTTFGLTPVLVHDGVEAILSIQRLLPRAVILDAALPKMFGFQICEMVKRNESLRSIHVALIGSVHHPDRYRRPPSDLYGADVYLEKPELLESLGSLLARFGFDVNRPAVTPLPARPATPRPAAPIPISAPMPLPAPAARLERPADRPAAVPKAAAPALAPAVADGLAAERANAERLARIIVSDIVLYQPEMFEQGFAPGQLVKALEGALKESRGFFAQRIDARVREEKDYLMEELTRVARERAGR